MAEIANLADKEYLYKLLGCDELSSEEQIITEYKLRAKALHPDKNGDVEATDNFITLTRAKEILCDKEKRKQYDTWRRSCLDISFDVWLKMAGSNQMSMHWAPLAKKQKMIENCEDGIGDNKESSSTRTKSPKEKKSESVNICGKKTTWKRKGSWGDSKLSKFRNYKI
ncbi:J domain-containing protein-like [Dendronephthya gigantea]|uniref:J domain-containing protein-like n=1 Tax=Dendronephthya gigantea TaxID=151771 RepID=UPI00106B378C|nr:J domain-containing protein-like [Dendronephthya gigantea]